MYSVFVLYSKSYDQIYIGQTNNLSKRLEEHNSGISFHTKKYSPWDLIYSKEYQTRSEAMKREKKLKSHKGRDFIRDLILNGGVRQLPDNRRVAGFPTYRDGAINKNPTSARFFIYGSSRVKNFLLRAQRRNPALRAVESRKFYKYKEDVVSQIISGNTYGWDLIPSHHFNKILASKELSIAHKEGSK